MNTIGAVPPMRERVVREQTAYANSAPYAGQAGRCSLTHHDDSTNDDTAI